MDDKQIEAKAEDLSQQIYQCGYNGLPYGLQYIIRSKALCELARQEMETILGKEA